MFSKCREIAMKKVFNRNTQLAVTLKTNLRPNFKPIKIGGDFSLERYALGVYNELCITLGGLVEE